MLKSDAEMSAITAKDFIIPLVMIIIASLSAGSRALRRR
jgi:hypothetical protein